MRLLSSPDNYTLYRFTLQAAPSPLLPSLLLVLVLLLLVGCSV